MSIEKTHNPFRSIKIEFHILQAFPVSCLNRDEAGTPKSAFIGGANRARVSSQCWKRAVRLALRDEFGVPCGIRTKIISSIVSKKCLEAGATEKQATACAEHLAKALSKKLDKDKKDGIVRTDTVIFVTESELNAVVEVFKKAGFSTNAITDKNLAKTFKTALKEAAKKAADGFDLALFGRMLAKVPELKIEGACSFSHAISTHEVTNELDFFTAVDDKDACGSAHMDSSQYNSATYYRYISLDLGELWDNLHVDTENSKVILDAIDNFTKALYTAIPSAKQATLSSSCPWDYAQILVRKGQRLQVSFETPVQETGAGFLKPSTERLKAELKRIRTQSGSLFKELNSFEFGEDPGYSIDNLVKDIRDTVSSSISEPEKLEKAGA